MHKLSFTCNICNNAFTENGYLKTHKLSFTCNICANTLTENQNLKMHNYHLHVIFVIIHLLRMVI